MSLVHQLLQHAGDVRLFDMTTCCRLQLIVPVAWTRAGMTMIFLIWICGSYFVLPFATASKVMEFEILISCEN